MASGVARPGLSRLPAAQRPCCNVTRPPARTPLFSTCVFCFNTFQRRRSGSIYFRQAGAGDSGQQAVGPSCHLVAAAGQDLRLCHVHGREAGETQALLFLQTLSNLSQTLSAAGIGQTVPKGHSSRTSPPRCVIPKVLRLVCCALTVTVRDIWWKLHPYTSSSLGDHGNSCDSLSFGVLLQLLFCP